MLFIVIIVSVWERLHSQGCDDYFSTGWPEGDLPKVHKSVQTENNKGSDPQL